MVLLKKVGLNDESNTIYHVFDNARSDFLCPKSMIPLLTKTRPGSAESSLGYLLDRMPPRVSAILLTRTSGPTFVS